MATEAPLLHHTQFQAGVNMSSTAGLAGFNGSGQFLVVSQVGGTGRTSTTFATVIIASAATVLPAGIVQNDPISGFVADIGFLGISKVICAAAGVTFANPIMASGGLGTVINGNTFATNYAVGYSLETGTSAQVITAMIFPAVLD